MSLTCTSTAASPAWCRWSNDPSCASEVDRACLVVSPPRRWLAWIRARARGDRGRERDRGELRVKQGLGGHLGPQVSRGGGDIAALVPLVTVVGDFQAMVGGIGNRQVPVGERGQLRVSPCRRGGTALTWCCGAGASPQRQQGS